ncbi:MAG: class IV adenylate cyclase [Phycisphaerae bacterium]|nr:class IV adenylate cyclase [Phycisphaerae bacterium]
MSHVNIEIKARCPDLWRAREILKQHKADFRGIDNQLDTYFPCKDGRLKLREGNIENALIYYRRPDQSGPKQANVTLCRLHPDPVLRQVLSEALGVRVQVIKQREIYFIDHVKIHLDKVDPLGSFIEIEALDLDGSIGRDRLMGQCRLWMDRFGIRSEDLIDRSYSDMIEDLQRTTGNRS